jgi:acetyl esterase
MENPVPLSCFSPELQQLLDRIGPLWAKDMVGHRNQTWAAFEPLLKKAPKDGITVTRDLPYGPHARHVLDLYRPETPKAGAPILVFVHGGAFVRGDKNVSEEGYANVLFWFARQGYLGINLEYRLATDAPYPGGADDVARAVEWIKTNAAEHGGDAKRIFLMGHSAGGTHVASYAYDPALPYRGRDVAGVALISARLRADVLAENPNAGGVRAYFGADESKYDVRSPVMHGADSTMPTFIAVAEFENPLLDVYGAELFYRMSHAKRRAGRFLRLARHNHISMVAHFNTEEEILGRDLLRFFESSK